MGILLLRPSITIMAQTRCTGAHLHHPARATVRCAGHYDKRVHRLADVLAATISKPLLHVLAKALLVDTRALFFPRSDGKEHRSFT